MPKSQDIVINNFQKGIGESLYTGFGRFQNLEIFQTPGAVKMKPRQALYFTPDSLPMAMVKDAYNNLWTGTYNGKLYLNTLQAGTQPGGAYIYDPTNTPVTIQVGGPIYDLKIVQDYLFIAWAGGASGGISLIGPLNPASGAYYYFANWKTAGIEALYGKPLAVLTGNSTVYFGNGNNIGAITAFTPNANHTIAPTATLNTAAIPLQSGDFVQTLTVLGRNLLIGTQGGSYFNSVAASGTSNIYPYDLGSLILGTPILLEENGINQMFTVNNLTYIHAGIYGNIYVTNGSSVQFYKRLNFDRTFATTTFPYPNAINYINNELLIGTSSGNDNFQGSFGSSAIHGIYSIRSGALNFKTISTYNYGASQPLHIGCILPAGQDIVYAGWQDGTTYGVDYTDFVMAQNFNAFFESRVEIVAEPQNGATFDDIIVYLANPLIAGQQIRLRWRDGRNNPWNTIGTLTAASGPSGATALFAKALISNAKTVQIQCALKQADDAQVGNNVEILAIKIIKHTENG